MRCWWFRAALGKMFVEWQGGQGACWPRVTLSVLGQGTVAPATAEVLERLVSLWGLAALTRECGDFMEDGYLSGQQARTRKA